MTSKKAILVNPSRLKYAQSNELAASQFTSAFALPSAIEGATIMPRLQACAAKDSDDVPYGHERPRLLGGE
jgi:hypothetical protein